MIFHDFFYEFSSKNRENSSKFMKFMNFQKRICNPPEGAPGLLELVGRDVRARDHARGAGLLPEERALAEEIPGGVLLHLLFFSFLFFFRDQFAHFPWVHVSQDFSESISPARVAKGGRADHRGRHEHDPHQKLEDIVLHDTAEAAADRIPLQIGLQGQPRKARSAGF